MGRDKGNRCLRATAEEGYAHSSDDDLATVFSLSIEERRRRVVYLEESYNGRAIRAYIYLEEKLLGRGGSLFIINKGDPIFVRKLLFSSQSFQREGDMGYFYCYVCF